MKRNKMPILITPRMTLLFLVLCFLLSAHRPAVSSSGEKVILTTHNLYPYGSYPDGGEIRLIADESFRGTAVDLVRCVFKKMDIPLEIQVVPWKRAQMLVIAGEADGFFAASQLDARDEFAVMLSSPVIFFPIFADNIGLHQRRQTCHH